jgi:hypothetical protein
MLLAWAIVMTLLFGVSVWLNYRAVTQNLMLNDQREELVTQIEESLDMLDTCYARLAHHANIPVVSDDPVVQDIVHDMKMARNTVLAIASKVVEYGGEPTEKEEHE